MVEAPDRIIEDFCHALREKCGEHVSPGEIKHEYLRAPHVAGDLPSGMGAVYVFTLPGSSEAPAGPHRALKAGKAGPKSNPRFKTQHYRGSAPSTLKDAIENNPILFDILGIDALPMHIGDWICKNTDRDNFFVDGSRKQLLSFLDIYIKARLGPVFEGSLSSKA